MKTPFGTPGRITKAARPELLIEADEIRAGLGGEDLKMKSEPEIADIFKAAGVKAGDTVVSYCHTGQQATLVYLAAKRLGLKARVYDGSWDEWSRRTDLPVETTPIKN